MKTDRLILRSLVKLLAVWLTILLGMTNGWAVMLSPTSAQLSVTPNPAMAGQTVTLTMTVTGIDPAAPPTGQVTFKEGLAVLGSVNLNNGIAALNTRFNTAGIHGVTATYAGDGNNGGTSMTTWFTITAAATTTQLVPSANPARPDQAVTLTATVTGVNPTGTVTFKNGNTLLGSALLTAGTASITRTFGTVGNYPLTAGYNGDTNNLASTSSPLTLTVSIEPQVYYIHTDHLDTPRTITDTGGNVVWQWDNTDPFGANMPNENPGGAGQFAFNLRFAGQYFDRETGLNYNINRDYAPANGRYIQSDPIGLAGGINTYTYVSNNPIRGLDPFGLSSITVDRSTNLLKLTDKNGNFVAFYHVANNTTNPAGDPNTVGSNGPAPTGVWQVQSPINTSGDIRYGPYFWPIGAVDTQGNPADIARQRGIGLHGGRSSYRSRTYGCMRMDDADILDLYRETIDDPITTIDVR